MKNGTYRACPKAHNELKSLGFSESQIPPWISRVRIQDEGEFPIIKGEPVEEGRSSPPVGEEPPKVAEVPPYSPGASSSSQGSLGDEGHPLGAPPIGQEASEDEGGGRGRPGTPVSPERGEGEELEDVYEREARFNRQLRDQGIFETVDGYGQARAG